MKIGHVLSYTHTPFHIPLHTPFHILLIHPFTKPYTPTPYTPIPSINIPFLTIISLTFSILKTPKLISELNHLLIFHLLSFLFHNHKTFHFLSTNPNPSESTPPSPSIFFTCFIFFIFIFISYLLHISALLMYC